MQPVTQITVFYLDHRSDGIQHLFVDGKYSFSEELHMHEKLEGICDFLDTKCIPYKVDRVYLDPKTEKIRDKVYVFIPKENQNEASFYKQLLKSFTE